MKFKTAKAKIENSHQSRVHVTTFEREDFKEELSTEMGFGVQDLKEKPKKLFTKLMCAGYDVEVIPNFNLEGGFGVDIYVEKHIKKIYLAIPYTGLVERAYEIANKVAAEYIDKGHVVFSPITHSHPLAELVKGENTWDFWKMQDLPMIDWCDEVVVINIGENGFELIDNSRGVQAEIKYARSIGKRVEYYEYGK